jgi:hypothetical protein
MKNPIKFFTVIAAFSAAAFTANAGVTSVTSDLVLGVSDFSGTKNVLVNLGSINSYAPAGGLAAGTYTIGNYSSLLTSAFGADLSGLSWGVIGNAGLAGAATNGDPIRTTWITSAWDNSTAGVLGVQNSVAYDRPGQSVLGTTNGMVKTVYDGLTNATAGQTNAGLHAVTLTNGAIWDDNAGFNLDGSLFDNQLGRLALSQSYSAADLYTVSYNGVAGSESGAADSKFDGTFAFDATTGVLTFTAIPEPSTYAMILGVATLGFAAIRRRKQAQLLA